MIIVYLNSKDQASQNEALVAAGVCKFIDQPIPDSDEVELIVVPNEGYVIDELGVVENIDGYLCNLLGDFTDEQLALLPTVTAPSTPIRTFAGW